MAKSKNKWKTLEHNGVIEQPAYAWRLDNTTYSLQQEEILYNYAKFVDTKYQKTSIFQRNFKAVVKKYFGSKYSMDTIVADIFKLSDIIEQEKEAKKLLTREQKAENALYNAELKEKYGFANIDGQKQPLGAYMIEPCGVFIGRGESPLTGCWKERTPKSKVTLNISKTAMVPDGDWGKVEQNKNSLAIATYKVALSNGHFIDKSVLFGSTSTVKQQADKHKFDKAKKVLAHWTEIDTCIQKGIEENQDDVAMVAWLVKNLGIRIGDEKDSDMEAETFGASTLLGKHLTKKSDGVYQLSFLGKDSVLFTKDFDVPEYVACMLDKKIAKTAKGTQLFPSIKSRDVSDFLNDIVPGITPKIFRTAWGTSLLAKELSAYKDKGQTEKQKVLFYNQANLAVAKQLNHQKAPSKNYKEQVKNMSDRVKVLAEQIKDLQNKDAKKNKDKISKKKVQLKELKGTLALKKETKNYALGTSKANYCSPEVTYSFCKDVDLNIDKVYTKALQTKFAWAQDALENCYKKLKIK